MPQIHYKTGDATLPRGEGRSIIAHICNDLGAWGKGFVLAVSSRWATPESAYRDWFAQKTPRFELGAVQLVEVNERILVANMIAQHGIRGTKKAPPIRYDALRSCLESLAEDAVRLGASIHMPRIGCGLAGGKWEKIEPIIEEVLVAAELAVHVYDFKPAMSLGAK